MEKINPLFTCQTGDPFVDLGGNVIKYLSAKFPGKTILELIEYAANIYISGWGGKINSFFLNHPVTQGQYDSTRKMNETMKYYQSLIDDVDSRDGVCCVSGEKTKVFKAGRNNMILTGSEGYINFSPGMNGVYLSKEVIIRNFFIPLGSIQQNRKIAVIQSNNNEINYLYAQLNCERNEISDKLIVSKFWGVGGFIFNFIDAVHEKKIAYREAASLTLYHFTNFGAFPDIEIFHVHQNTVTFYRRMQEIDVKHCWDKIVNGLYKNHIEFKDAVYDIDNDEYIGRNGNIAGYDAYRFWYNLIFDKLIGKMPILDILRDYAERNNIEMDIVKFYVLLVRNK